MKISAQTRENQARATDPRASAFVSANAGSGKTYVLTRRVIRLLLDGADPGRILCLTFTKAAAAEMANRVFDELSTWTTADDESLAATLSALEGRPVDRARIDVARRLFARALETPGGLKVQTIHAFAEALLQRFALEANLDGRFSVLDEVKSEELFVEARTELIALTASAPDSTLGRAFVALIGAVSDQGFDEALRAVVGERAAFADWIIGHGDLEAALDSLPAALGLTRAVSAAELRAESLDAPDFAGPTLSALIDVLDGASSSMREAAEAFRAALAAPTIEERRRHWLSIFLTKDLAPKKRAFTADVEKKVPGVNERFAREAERLVAIETELAAQETVERTGALLRLADRLIGLIAVRKARLGALDFDDLIERAAALLSRSDAAAWVQYKLDEGLDHVLVDEAQDTSPRQWQIIHALTGDFHAGEGARGDRNRTVFAVGDEKQSIYSFQGAAPHLFGAARKGFGTRLRGAGRTVHDLSLTLSFRSAAAVIQAVDKVFAPAAAHAGLSTDGTPPTHETARGREPGLVELWPERQRDKADPDDNWVAPVDKSSDASPAVRLAQDIAATIAGWISRGERIAATGKPIRPGDILVLVRKRGPFVQAVNRSLKAAGIAVAGADRLDVTGHIITRDLLAAARVALLPEDDLTLATLARSPLVGLSDETLFSLAHGRDGSLWTAVRAKAQAGDAAAERLRGRVADWMRHAGRSEPYDFFARILGPDGARAAYRARFGREADEVIDEFLALVIAYEGEEAGGLNGLVDRISRSGERIKRELDASRDEVRVMTVHGSKGLEAPVVFLIDPGDAAATAANLPTLVRIDGGALVWPGPKPYPAPLATAAEAFLSAQRDEYRRLLYVGLTRARDRLVIAGIKRHDKGYEERWHGLVSAALRSEAEEIRDDDGAVTAWRWRPAGEEPPAEPRDDRPVFAEQTALPPWLFQPADASLPERRIRPSAAGGEALADEDTAASRRGTAVHTLLELLPDLPEAERAPAARAFLERELAEVSESERERLVGQVTHLLADPALAPLFSTDSRAEAAIGGTIHTPQGRTLAVSGQVDRLFASATDVVIVDYKTARQPPSHLPERYLLQLALYRRVAMDLWPDRPVRAAIVWTEGPRIDWADAADLDAALAAHLAVTDAAATEP